LKVNYPSKILLAWAEAIGGSKEIREFLTKNGYRELGMFVFALHNKDDAKKWLMDNGFQHLAATISGAEGQEAAIKWLNRYELDVLAKAALTGDGNQAAFKWLVSNGHKEMAMVGKKIQQVKDDIERDNNDVHKISQE
jgi:hypothetical protein